MGLSRLVLTAASAAAEEEAEEVKEEEGELALRLACPRRPDSITFRGFERMVGV